MAPIHLSSGLASGWALGTNDTSGILGPVVGSRMLTFRQSAICCGLFLILGALCGGESPSQTLLNVSNVHGPIGAFIIALAAVLSVSLMSFARCPVSTVQAMTGAIIGFCIASGARWDDESLMTLGLVWFACPVLSAILAVCLYKLVAALIKALHINIFRLDRMTRAGLFLACAFASYQLGANNIPATLGVFLPVSPFTDLSPFGMVRFNAAHQLYLLGGVAAAAGLYTWGRHMAEHTGDGLFRLSSAPLMALVAVLTQGLVIYLFTSRDLAVFLRGHGFLALPLVPVSGCQSIVGAMLGLSLLNKGFNFSRVNLGKLTAAWLVTPILAALLSWLAFQMI